MRDESLVRLIWSVVCLNVCRAAPRVDPFVRHRGQWMAAYLAVVPLFYANQLPLPGLQSAAVHESCHVSSAISSILTFTFYLYLVPFTRC